MVLLSSNVLLQERQEDAQPQANKTTKKRNVLFLKREGGIVLFKNVNIKKKKRKKERAVEIF